MPIEGAHDSSYLMAVVTITIYMIFVIKMDIILILTFSMRQGQMRNVNMPIKGAFIVEHIFRQS